MEEVEKPKIPPAQKNALRNGTRILRAIALVIVLAGTALRMQDFASPWTSDHRGWSGSYYGNIARNYVEHGYLTTKFGAVQNVAPRDASEFVYYVNHPPLFGLLVSVSFHVFGVSEWAVRLVPLVASAISLLLIFLIARKLWGETVALYALAAFAVMPMGAFFGTLANVQGPVVLLFCLLTIYFYLLFRDRPSAANAALMCAAFTLGALTDWPAFCLAPLLAIHYYVWKPRARRSRLVLPPLLLVVVLGAAYLPYSNWLLGAEPFDLSQLRDQFLWCSDGAGADSPSGDGFTPLGWFARVFGGWWPVYFTPPVLLLLAAWTAVVAVRIRWSRSDAADGIFLLTLVFALLYIFIFRQGAYVHSYWSFYALVPASLACGLCVKTAAERVFAKHTTRIAIGAAVMLVIAASSLAVLTNLWADLSDTSDAQIAVELDERCGGEGRIVTDVCQKELLYFYLNQPISGVHFDPESLAEIAEDKSIDYIYLSAKVPGNAPLYNFLAEADPDYWLSRDGAKCSGMLVRREKLAQALEAMKAQPEK